MVYCPNCGTYNRDTASYCNDCGGEIRYDGLSQPKKEVGQLATVQLQQFQKPEILKKQELQPILREESVFFITIVSLIVFCIPIIGFAIYLMLRTDDPKVARIMLISSILGCVSYLSLILMYQ